MNLASQVCHTESVPRSRQSSKAQTCYSFLISTRTPISKVLFRPRRTLLPTYLDARSIEIGSNGSILVRCGKGKSASAAEVLSRLHQSEETLRPIKPRLLKMPPEKIRLHLPTVFGIKEAVTSRRPPINPLAPEPECHCWLSAGDRMPVVPRGCY